MPGVFTIKAAKSGTVPATKSAPRMSKEELDKFERDINEVFEQVP